MIAPNTGKRLKILKFWQNHGLAATMAAFEVSRRTLFAWKRRLKAAGPAGLGPHSTRPKRIRRRLWPERPHHALGLNTPASVVASCLPHTQCRMYWPNTLGLTFCEIQLVFSR